MSLENDVTRLMEDDVFKPASKEELAKRILALGPDIGEYVYIDGHYTDDPGWTFEGYKCKLGPETDDDADEDEEIFFYFEDVNEFVEAILHPENFEFTITGYELE